MNEKKQEDYWVIKNFLNHNPVEIGIILIMEGGATLHEYTLQELQNIGSEFFAIEPQLIDMQRLNKMEEKGLVSIVKSREDLPKFQLEGRGAWIGGDLRRIADIIKKSEISGL